jgi:hypothetical protein
MYHCLKIKINKTYLTKNTSLLFLKTTSKAMGRPRMAANGQLRKAERAVVKIANAKLWFILYKNKTHQVRTI